ncbi:MAG: hypothetical protein II974_10465, partial [Firmicutes bacterium]|nr:hypothetical protein [Bacillota bacterium]
HALPEDKSIFCQRYMDERIYISIDRDHPIARQESVTFEQLKGLRILVSEGIGFWMNICKEHLDPSDLLIQHNMDALTELVEASSLPVFNSDRMIDKGDELPGRVSVPISDDDAVATYWLACLAPDQRKYRSVFNAVRSYALRHE